ARTGEAQQAGDMVRQDAEVRLQAARESKSARPVDGVADDGDRGISREDLADAFADEPLVVRDEDTQHCSAHPFTREKCWSGGCLSGHALGGGLVRKSWVENGAQP